MLYNPSKILEAIGKKDEVTYRHSLEVGRLLKEFALFLGQGEEQAELLYEAGLLHDVGKMFIPDDILKKPGTLTDKEFKEIKTHPTQGFEFLQKAGAPELVCQIALGHHLSFSGGGYPFPEKNGEKILLAVRMATIVDVYEALSSKRPYKEAMSKDKVIQIMDTSLAFDAKLYGKFKEMIKSR